MQLGNRHDLIAQGSDLADHEHAVVALTCFADDDDLAGRVAIKTFRGNAQATEIEVLEGVANVFDAAAVADQLAPRVVEIARELGFDAARRMAGAGFEIQRLGAAQRDILEAGNDRTGADDLAREQIGRAHQRADFHAARGERCGHRRHHRGRSGVVDAAGKQHVNFLLVADRNLGEQHVDHLLPQREARNRTDMATALAAFEHEAARSLFEIQREERRRRCVDIGWDAFAFELGGLVWTAAGDQRKCRPAGEDLRALLVAQRLGDEAEHADAPRHVADALLRVLQHLAHLRTAHQCERKERQRAGCSDFRSERR